MAVPEEIRSNFSHLATLDAQLVRLGRLAERYFSDDPNTALVTEGVVPCKRGR